MVALQARDFITGFLSEKGIMGRPVSIAEDKARAALSDR